VSGVNGPLVILDQVKVCIFLISIISYAKSYAKKHSPLI